MLIIWTYNYEYFSAGPDSLFYIQNLVNDTHWLTELPTLKKEQIQEDRLALPILSEEANILEAIASNDVVIICGETGSGKTTQLPQFLYEAGYAEHGVIGVTEPRRIAAISAAGRVRFELGLEEPLVGHHIRYECKGMVHL